MKVLKFILNNVELLLIALVLFVVFSVFTKKPKEVVVTPMDTIVTQSVPKVSKVAKNDTIVLSQHQRVHLFNFNRRK